MEAERKEADNIAVTEKLKLVAERDALRAQLAEMYQSETSTVTLSECWAAPSLSDLPPPLLPMHMDCFPLSLQATSVVWTWSQRPALRSPVRPTPMSGGAMESSFTSSKTPSQPTADSAGWR